VPIVVQHISNAMFIGTICLLLKTSNFQVTNTK